MALENTHFTRVKPIFFFVVYKQRFVGFRAQFNVEAPLIHTKCTPPGTETLPRNHSPQCSEFKNCLQLEKKKRFK